MVVTTQAFKQILYQASTRTAHPDGHFRRATAAPPAGVTSADVLREHVSATRTNVTPAAAGSSRTESAPLQDGRLHPWSSEGDVKTVCLLTTEEIAARFRTSRATVRYWRRVGIGPTGIRVGRGVLYEREYHRWWQTKVAAALHDTR
jgi:hypothetical protein